MKLVNKGYTLLEIVVALSILSIAITVILQLFSINLRAISRSEDYVHALIQAEMKMRELLQSEDLLEDAWQETTNRGHRLDISVVEILKDRTENLQFSLLEVNLTISWTDRLSNKSYTIKSYKTVAKILQ